MPDPLVLAQPAYRDPGQAGRDSIAAIEAGQGLRARSDAMRRQRVLDAREDQDFERQQKIRELMGSGNEEAAKSLMTLQERGQLVNIWGMALDQKKTILELDATEKALKQGAGFFARGAAMDPKSETFSEERAKWIADAAAAIGANPKLATTFRIMDENLVSQNLEHKRNTPGTVEHDQMRIAAAVASKSALSAEQQARLGPAAEKAVSEMHIIAGQNKSVAERAVELNQWKAANAELLSSVIGKDMEAAFNSAYDGLIAESRLSGRGERSLKAGDIVVDPALGREIQWAPQPYDRIDLQTGEPLYVLAYDEETGNKVLTKNPNVWPKTAQPGVGTEPPEQPVVPVAQPQAGGLRTISTKSGYDALPPGTRFIGPDGRTYYKPETRESEQGLSDLVTGG